MHLVARVAPIVTENTEADARRFSPVAGKNMQILNGTKLRSRIEAIYIAVSLTAFLSELGTRSGVLINIGALHDCAVRRNELE